MDSAPPVPPLPEAPSTPSSAIVALSFDDTKIAFAHQSAAEIRKAHLLFSTLNYPWLMRMGSALAAFALQARLPGARLLVKHTVFDHFCGGETLAECEGVVETLGRFGVQSILDYSAEGAKTEEGFDETERQTLATIEWGARHPSTHFGVFKVTGLARFGLLEKVHAGAKLTPDEEAEWQRVRRRVERICQKSAELGARTYVDAEETWIQDAVDGLAEEMMARFNRERAVVSNTYQLYRTDSLANLKAAHARAKASGYRLGAKLVRGAYMEKERERAEALGVASPIHPDKAATDRAYDEAVLYCLDHLDSISLFAGTHNEASCLKLTQELARRGIPRDDRRVLLSQLYGMSDNITFNLARAGYNVAKYVPYGPVSSVMPYLMRRAQENSAIAGQGSRELRLIQTERRRRKAAR
jgi:proline dehydrogenase